MVDFRRCITALAMLALFAGLAAAQVGGAGQEQCVANVSVTPTLRAEGYTEQTGDITLTCTGGANPVAGSIVPQVNITVFLNTQVTSRLIPISTPVTSNNTSEALLLIDEPLSGIPVGPGNPNVGPSFPQTLCTTPTTGCTTYVGTQAYTSSTGLAGTAIPAGTMVSGCTTFSSTGVCTTTNNTPGPNVYQGLVSGNSVTFLGVPALPPVTTGTARIYRITNIRANTSALSGGSAAGATPVIASISVNGATSLLITNPTPTVGFVQSGLSATASGATTQNQCSSATKASVNTLSFAENFATAFKTRVLAQANSAYAGQSFPLAAGTNQSTPGSIYNSESNFIFPVNGGASQAGLADFGTRLKAVFSNVPAGVRLFVSINNVVNNNLPIPTPSSSGATPAGGSAGNAAGTGGLAQLINGETTADGNAGSGFFPLVPTSENAPTAGGNVPVAEIPVLNGSATAVWEVVNTNPNTQETLKFGVYSTFSANTAQNSPPPGTGTVNLSFAPTPTTAFTAAAGSAASSTLPIPRFIADTSAARNFDTIVICRTILLYPYVTNIQGFDTGLAIANTTTDPFGTGAQSGTCALNWYQGTANPPVGNSGNIASGTIYTTLASTAVPGFNGYMIAVCNFQYAHGFAFVSDVGARNLAMGYLAVVIADPGTGSRAAQPFGGSITSSGEQGGH